MSLKYLSWRKSTENYCEGSLSLSFDLKTWRVYVCFHSRTCIVCPVCIRHWTGCTAKNKADLVPSLMQLLFLCCDHNSSWHSTLESYMGLKSNFTALKTNPWPPPPLSLLTVLWHFCQNKWRMKNLLSKRFQVSYSTVKGMDEQGIWPILINTKFPVINPNAPGRSSPLNKCNVRTPLGGSEALAQARVSWASWYGSAGSLEDRAARSTSWQKLPGRHWELFRGWGAGEALEPWALHLLKRATWSLFPSFLCSDHSPDLLSGLRTICP